MTIEEKIRQYLAANGLISVPLDYAVKHVKADPKLAAMDLRWESDAETLPPHLWHILAFSVSASVGEWLDADMPDAPFRSNFE